ncbi:MAG: class I SAM-dependent methyltransferase [Bryobacteraceae bacterium]
METGLRERMPVTRPSSSYDEIADMYHALWADWYLPAALPALEKLFFARVPSGARVLDVCCGSGHVTEELVRRGYRVTGVDSSSELIALARAALPEVDFRVQDARNIQLESAYDAALSTFDSLNHLLSLADLRDAFAGVRRTLAPGGMFVFDMNLEEAYSLDLREWTVDLAPERIGLVRGTYDMSTKKATTELICFVREGGDNLWRQSRSVVEQRCYPQSEILLALNEGGFRGVESFMARTAGVSGGLGFGRAFFRAWRQE